MVFLLCGLWHGAAWNFVLWGAWHGLFLVFERVGLNRLLARAPRMASWVYTVIMGGWVLFRSRDLTAARQLVAGLFGLNGFNIKSFEVYAALQPVVILGAGLLDVRRPLFGAGRS